MRVYVIRHGESETNKLKKLAGWFDARLTEKGKDDARKAGIFLKDISFDRIYSSDLLRTRETVETAIPGCRYETSLLLREINVGSLAGEYRSVITEKQRSEIEKNGYISFGGESKKEFHDRVARFLKGLEDSDCENIAVFSHAGCLREILETVLGVKISKYKICCNNCTVAIFEFEDNSWKFNSWINMM